MGEIVWPPCVSLIGVSKATGFFGSVFSSSSMKVFSVSGGQLQYSNHPALKSINASTAAEKLNVADTSRSWDLKKLTDLDGFEYDPRDAGCTGHVSVQGGLYGATFQSHSDTDVTIVCELDPTPLRIQFLSEEHCAAFLALVNLHKDCCTRKFQGQLGKEVEAVTSKDKAAKEAKEKEAEEKDCAVEGEATVAQE